MKRTFSILLALLAGIFYARSSVVNSQSEKVVTHQPDQSEANLHLHPSHPWRQAAHYQIYDAVSTRLGEDSDLHTFDRRFLKPRTPALSPKEVEQLASVVVEKLRSSDAIPTANISSRIAEELIELAENRRKVNCGIPLLTHASWAEHHTTSYLRRSLEEMVDAKKDNITFLSGRDVLTQDIGTVCFHLLKTQKGNPFLFRG
jgi:hypothetical protein